MLKIIVQFYKKTVKQFQDENSGNQVFKPFLLENLNYYPFKKGNSQYPFLNFLKQIITRESNLGKENTLEDSFLLHTTSSYLSLFIRLFLVSSKNRKFIYFCLFWAFQDELHFLNTNKSWGKRLLYWHRPSTCLMNQEPCLLWLLSQFRVQWLHDELKVKHYSK